MYSLETIRILSEKSILLHYDFFLFLYILCMIFFFFNISSVYYVVVPYSLISLGFGVELIATEFFLQACAYLSVP